MIRSNREKVEDRVKRIKRIVGPCPLLVEEGFEYFCELTPEDPEIMVIPLVGDLPQEFGIEEAEGICINQLIADSSGRLFCPTKSREIQVAGQPVTLAEFREAVQLMHNSMTMGASGTVDMPVVGTFGEQGTVTVPAANSIFSDRMAALDETCSECILKLLLQLRSWA